MSEIDSLFKYNCSTLFLLFPLGLDRRKLMDFGFQAVYIQDSEVDVPYECPVFVLFKPSDMTLFQAFVDSEYMRVNPHTETFDLVEDYDYEKGYVVLLYNMPELFREDYNKFKQGKYSRFSDKFKNSYPRVIRIKDGNGRVSEVIGTAYKIINKNNEELREEVRKRGELDMRDELEKRFDTIITPDMELWEPPSFDYKEGNEKKTVEERNKDVLYIKKILENERIKESHRRIKKEETDT